MALELICYPEPHPFINWHKHPIEVVFVFLDSECPLHHDDDFQITKLRREVADWLMNNMYEHYYLLGRHDGAWIPGIVFESYPLALQFKLRWDGVTEFDDRA